MGRPSSAKRSRGLAEQAVAVGEVLVGAEGFQVDWADGHGGAQIGSRGGIDHDARSSRELWCQERLAAAAKTAARAALAAIQTPARAQVTDVTICVEGFARHSLSKAIPEIVYLDMPMVQAAAIALIALILTPGWLFYFDVTPKVVVLLAACGVAMVPLRRGRLMGLVMLTLASLALSTALSPNPALSFYGTHWRQYGALTQAAVLIFAWSTFRTDPPDGCDSYAP